MNSRKLSKGWRALFGITLGPVLVSGSLGLPEPQKLTTTANVVVVDVVALAADRTAVSGLRQEDFRLYVDGRERTLSAFSVVDRRRTPSSSASQELAAQESTGAVLGPPAVDAASTQLGNRPDGRIVLIVLDRSIPQTAMPAARRIAHMVVDNLYRDDLAAVLRTTSFSNDGLQTGLTSDVRRLRTAIDSPSMGSPTVPIMEPGGLREAPASEPTGDCLCGACTFDRLRGIASSLAAAPRLRKVVFLIAASMPDEIGRGVSCMSMVSDARQDLYRELDSANLTVHVMDPLGLQTDALDAGALPGTTASARRAAGIDRRSSLRALPEHTGGRTVTDSNQPEQQVAAALQESAVYYLLGFEPTAGADGKRHRIDLRVSDRRVKILRWRKSYESTP